MTVRPLSSLGLALLMSIGLSDAAVSYVRWGRTVCPTGAIKLYSGYMVNHHWQGIGNGGNYLCTTDKPEFVRGQPGNQAISGYLFGVEFDRYPPFASLFKTDNVPSGDLNNQDMPCVRCYVDGSTDVFVLPGRQDCQDTGYDLQYKGFLASTANYQQHQPTEYICLDDAPEGIPGGSGDNNQAFVFPVQYMCGSLPCAPYVDGMEAPCAVCTW